MNFKKLRDEVVEWFASGLDVCMTEMQTKTSEAYGQKP